MRKYLTLCGLLTVKLAILVSRYATPLPYIDETCKTRHIVPYGTLPHFAISPAFIVALRPIIVAHVTQQMSSVPQLTPCRCYLSKPYLSKYSPTSAARRRRQRIGIISSGKLILRKVLGEVS